MSEDCHDSNNAPVQDDTQVVSCYACGEPVKPQDAFPCELENLDGTTEIAVFHSGIDRMCPLKWAGDQLKRINTKLEAILVIMDEVKGTDASSGL
jgi:hypothetical protein